ncbi:MAG: hypothetical protein WDN28_06365 [Chthoniobacter sp.]
MKTTLLTLAFATFTFAPGLRAEDAKPTNPALLYWQAAAILPQLTPGQAKEVRDVAYGRKPFDAAAAATILSDSKSSLRLAMKAANSPVPCDWGLPTEDGPFMALPHVSKLQEMASIAILQAETLFADGKVKEGPRLVDLYPSPGAARRRRESAHLQSRPVCHRDERPARRRPALPRLGCGHPAILRRPARDVATLAHHPGGLRRGTHSHGLAGSI